LVHDERHLAVGEILERQNFMNGKEKYDWISLET
jgi:hypothetical protein